MAKHLLHKKKSDEEAPHQPFYKDERIIGKTITVNVSLRLFVGAIVVGALLFGFALFRILKDDADLHNYLTHAHASRLADQAKMQQSVNQLACYIIASIPDKAAPIVPKFRAQYHCPPYGKDPNFKLYPKPTATPTSTKASPSPGTSSKTAQAGGGASVKSGGARQGSGGSGGSGGSRSTPVAGGPAPSPQPRPTGGGSHPSPAPAPSRSALVKLPVTVPSVIGGPVVGVGGTCAIRVGNTCVAG